MIGELRTKAGYKYTPKENKALEMLNDVVFEIGRANIDKSKILFQEFINYRDDNSLYPTFVQGQAANGEGVKSKWIGDRQYRLGIIFTLTEQIGVLLYGRSSHN